MNQQLLDRDVTAEHIARIVETSGATTFSDAMARLDDVSEEALADLVYADGRARQAIGQQITLAHYRAVLPKDAERSLALDAAIDVCTQALIGEGLTLDDAIERLAAERPDLREQITRGALLHEIVSSRLVSDLTTSLLEDRELPAPFGPELPDGRPRYTLLQALGRGSFSVVYLARDEALSDGANKTNKTARVAIKVLSRTVESGAFHRFNREALLARRVEHDNVVRVIDKGQTEEETFIVYEFIDGESLRGWGGKKPGRHAIREIVKLVAQAADGLGALHEVGLLHRDIKPGNILIRKDGVVKVCDLGLADAPGVENADALRGNLALMAPERLLFGDAQSTVRSDVYSLAGLLYWMLTGAYPLGDNKHDIHRAAKHKLPPTPPRELNPAIDRDLEAVCLKGLSHNPLERYRSMDQLYDDLLAWVKMREVTARKRTPIGRLRLLARRQPVAAVSVSDRKSVV